MSFKFQAMLENSTSGISTRPPYIANLGLEVPATSYWPHVRQASTYYLQAGCYRDAPVVLTLKLRDHIGSRTCIRLNSIRFPVVLNMDSISGQAGYATGIISQCRPSVSHFNKRLTVHPNRQTIADNSMKVYIGHVGHQQKDESCVTVFVVVQINGGQRLQISHDTEVEKSQKYKDTVFGLLTCSTLVFVLRISTCYG